jgi:hypothetical protein
MLGDLPKYAFPSLQSSHHHRVRQRLPLKHRG